MDNNKVFKYVSESAGMQTPSLLQRVILAVQNLFFPASATNKQLIPVRSQTGEDSKTNLRRAALLNMLNHGKNYDDANLILDEAEEWELDYDLLNPSRIAVHGKSVWFDAED